MPNRYQLGVVPSGDGLVAFAAWAPRRRDVAVRFNDSDHSQEDGGACRGRPEAPADEDCSFVLDGRPYADPCPRRRSKEVELHDVA